MAHGPLLQLAATPATFVVGHFRHAARSNRLSAKLFITVTDTARSIAKPQMR